MKRLTTITPSLLLGLTLAAGCSSSFSSGVSGDQVASELSDGDFTTFCESLVDFEAQFAEDNREATCKFAGTLAGAFASAFDAMADGEAICEASVMECTAATAMAGGDAIASCKMNDLTMCDATIAEIEDCINEGYDEYEETIGEFASKSCSELLNDTSMTATSTPTPGAACLTLEEKCPGLNFGPES